MNSVSIIGFLREVIDERHRYFEYELPYEEIENQKAPRIVVKYWESQPNPRLIVAPVNSRVAIQGHLDTSEKFGTIIVVEQFQAVR